MTGFVETQQVNDSVHCGVHDESSAQQEDDDRKVESPLQHSLPVNFEERLVEILDQVHHHEEQHHPQNDGDEYGVATHGLLLVCGGTPGLDGNVEQIVEPEHRLQKQQHHEIQEVREREQVGHARTLLARERSLREKLRAKSPVVRLSSCLG